MEFLKKERYAIKVSFRRDVRIVRSLSDMLAKEQTLPDASKFVVTVFGQKERNVTEARKIQDVLNAKYSRTLNVLASMEVLPTVLECQAAQIILLMSANNAIMEMNKAVQVSARLKKGLCAREILLCARNVVTERLKELKNAIVLEPKDVLTSVKSIPVMFAKVLLQCALILQIAETESSS